MIVVCLYSSVAPLLCRLMACVRHVTRIWVTKTAATRFSHARMHARTQTNKKGWNGKKG